MSTLLVNGRDLQGYDVDAPKFCTNIFTATLATGTASSVTVPSNFTNWIMYVRLEPAGWVWVSRTGTATVPAGGTFAASASELAVGTLEFRREVTAGDVISFITVNTTCDVMVELYAIS